MAEHTSIKRFSLGRILHYHFVEKKLNTAFGYVILTALCILVVLGTALFSWKAGPMLIVFVLGILVLIAIIKYPYFGFYFLISLSCFPAFIDRIVDLPISSNLLIDGLTYFVFLTFLIRYNFKKNIDLRFWTNPISIGMYFLFFILYH